MLRTLVVLLLLAGSATAQTRPAPPDSAGAALSAAPSTADTVRAIRRLYAWHRRVGAFLAVGAVGADLALAGVSAHQESSGYKGGGGSGYGSISSGPLLQFGFGGYAVIYAVPLLPFLVSGVHQLNAYSLSREAKVIANYQSQRQLPAKIRRQLRKHRYWK